MIRVFRTVHAASDVEKGTKHMYTTVHEE